MWICRGGSAPAQAEGGQVGLQMQRSWRFYLGVCAIALCVALAARPRLVWAEAEDLAPNSKAAILMDYNSGKVLYAKNADEPLPPASVTKIMTLALGLEAVAEGRAKMDDLVSTSARAASMGGAQIFLEEGEQMPLREILMAIAVGSANDASVALAEHLAGSETAFVEMMNAKAKTLGMNNTRFANPSGLTPDDGQQHVMSAWDIAILSRWAIDIPHFKEMVSTYGPVVMRPETKKVPVLYNFNRMLRAYTGMDGIKTGMTNPAGYCLSATAEREGLRLIAVSLGAPGTKERNADVAKMLNWGFALYKAVPVADPSQVVADARVFKGRDETVPLLPARRLSITLEKKEKVTPETRIELVAQVVAPVAKGQRLADLIVTVDGDEVGRVPLVAGHDVPASSLFQTVGRSVRSIFGGFQVKPDVVPRESPSDKQ